MKCECGHELWQHDGYNQGKCMHIGCDCKEFREKRDDPSEQPDPNSVRFPFDYIPPFAPAPEPDRSGDSPADINPGGGDAGGGRATGEF